MYYTAKYMRQILQHLDIYKFHYDVIMKAISVAANKYNPSNTVYNGT